MGRGDLAGWAWPVERDRDVLARADSVELKVVLGDAARARTLASSRPRRRRLYLLDTPTVDLARAGVVLRLRRRAGDRDDLVVKSRQAGADRLVVGSRVELDMLPGAAVWTAEVRTSLAPGVAAACLDGAQPLGRLLTGEQHRFVRDAARRRGLGGLDLDALDGLRVHGPVLIERTRVSGGLGRVRAVLERCWFPDGREHLELSARCHPSSTDDVAARILRWLTERGADVSPRQRTKIEMWVDAVDGATSDAGAP